MFQFHQNNSQLLFHIIVSLWGAGAFSRDFTTNLARWCRAFTRALKNEKLKAPPFPGPGGAGDTNDWCIIFAYIQKFGPHSAAGKILIFFTNLPVYLSDRHSGGKYQYSIAVSDLCIVISGASHFQILT